MEVISIVPSMLGFRYVLNIEYASGFNSDSWTKLTCQLRHIFFNRFISSLQNAHPNSMESCVCWSSTMLVLIWTHICSGEIWIPVWVELLSTVTETHSGSVFLAFDAWGQPEEKIVQSVIKTVCVIITLHTVIEPIMKSWSSQTDWLIFNITWQTRPWTRTSR